MAQPRQQEGQHMANMYADVHRLGQSGEYERALRVINKSKVYLVAFNRFEIMRIDRLSSVTIQMIPYLCALSPS